eukprot:s4393_g4.t1
METPDDDDNGPNPFWSEKTKGEWHLSGKRPKELPKVPSEDESEGSPVRVPITDAAPSGRAEGEEKTKGASEENQDEAEGSEEKDAKFRTPPSGRGKRIKGRDESKKGKGQGVKKPKPEKEVAPTNSNELQREIEKGMVEKLAQENAKLHAEIERMKQQQTATQQSQRGEYTPGGTRVPPGTPPSSPSVPLAFLGDYERVEGSRRMPKREERTWQPGGERRERGEDASIQDVASEWWTPPSGGGESIVVYDENGRALTEEDFRKMNIEVMSKCRDREALTRSIPPTNLFGAYGAMPVHREPHSSSQSGAHTAPSLQQAAQEINDRRYTWKEVEEIIQQARQEKRLEADKGGRWDEGLRSFQITLPTLPDAQIQNASLEAGDWLTQVRPLIADVSAAASTWWAKIEEETEKCYRNWLMAKPIDKLKVAAPDINELSKGNERLAQRVSVMLLQAIPAGVKQELIASRQMDATSILFKIYKTYQPGGIAERKQTLAQLTATTTASTPAEAVATLTLWKRQFQRAQELHASLPDPVLQVRALTTVMDYLLGQDQQASFRVSSYRMENSIDTAPTATSVIMFHALLLAEAEHMITSSADNKHEETPHNTNAQKPSVKAMTHTPTRGRDTPCKYWGTEGGCRTGKQCRFRHDIDALPDKHERCWICSAKGHRRQECTAGKKEEQSPGVTGGSEGREQGDNKGKSKGKGKKGGKEHGKTKDTYNSSSSATAYRGDNKNADNTAKDEHTTHKEGKGQTTGHNKEETTTGATEAALITEVTSLLRSIRLQEEPRIKMINMRSLTKEEGHTLLDGGATHCLRRKENEKEWKMAKEVSVKLAAGEVKMRQCEDTGTLLVEDHIQAIIPVNKTTQLGYVVHWDRDRCRIEHINHGKIPVEMRQGCPR